MLSVGLDTHLKMHQVEVQNEKRKVMWKGQVTNNKKGFDEFLKKLRTIERSNSDTISGVFVNPTATYHRPIQNFLETYGYVVYYVDPRVTASARMAENLGKVKSDKVDSHLLASAAWDNNGKAMERKPHVRESTSTLTRLLESVKKNVTRISNMISADLAEVFPEFLEFFPDLTSKTSIAILEKYSVPENVARSSKDDILNTLRKYSRNHYKEADAKRILDLAANTVGIPDDGTHGFRIRENVKRLDAELKVIEEIEAKIFDATKDNEDVKRIDDIRGIGTMNAVIIVSEIGPVGQFESALKLQSYGGSAPTMEGSGGKDRATGLSKIRNPHLANAIFESAVSTVNKRNEEFLKVFNREISKGKKPTQAYAVVGRRLLYHIFTILKNKKPYRQILPRIKGEGVSSTGT